MSPTRGTLLPRERAGKIGLRGMIDHTVSENPSQRVYQSLGESLAQPKRRCAVHQRADRCWMRRTRP